MLRLRSGTEHPASSMFERELMLTGTRLELQHLMYATLNDEEARHDWLYRAIRPMQVPPPPWHPGMKVTGDCSKGVQYICRWTPNAPDPMMNHWAVWGNSQTLWMVLPHLVSVLDLEVGDIIALGQDGRDHATLVLEAGADPLLWSFGHQGAPNSYRMSADTRERTFLKLPIVPQPLTPQEKLRAASGFYAWVAWKLGEGNHLWRPYGPSNPSVRPNVPKKISADWWIRYARYMADRKKGNRASTGSIVSSR